MKLLSRGGFCGFHLGCFPARELPGFIGFRAVGVYSQGFGV